MIGDVLCDIEGVVHYVDDIRMWGETKGIHDAWVQQVLDRLKKAGNLLAILTNVQSSRNLVYHFLVTA